MVPRAEVQGGAKNGETSWAREEGEHMTKSGVQTSYEKITTTQEVEC